MLMNNVNIRLEKLHQSRFQASRSHYSRVLVISHSFWEKVNTIPHSFSGFFPTQKAEFVHYKTKYKKKCWTKTTYLYNVNYRRDTERSDSGINTFKCHLEGFQITKDIILNNRNILIT